MAKSFDANLLNAYLESDYVFLPNREILTIGKIHPRMDHYFQSSEVDCYAWLTAWNPRSIQIDKAQNKLRNNSLRAQISDKIISKGYSQSKLNDWKEEGFWVGNLSINALLKICLDFSQNGFVYARKEQALQLILCGMH